MTRQEFVNQAAKNAFFSNQEIDKEKTIEMIRHKTGVNTNMDFLFDFLCGDGLSGHLMFSRFENMSNDKLIIGVHAIDDSTCFWDDIGQHVSMAAYIRNCTCTIEEFYLSEDGRFWNENHKLRFETEEELFDYLLTVEYDFHPVITEKTYEMLRHFGWYEGRRIDITDFQRELKKYGITLSQIQLDAISEFS